MHPACVRPACVHPMYVHPLQLLLLDVERMTAQGMFRTAIALQQLGCIALPDAPFNTGGWAGPFRPAYAW